MRNNKSIRSGLKEKIISLAKKGLSYRQIQKKLGCSKGLISYHLGEGQKAKTYKRTIKLRDKGKRYVIHKIMSSAAFYTIFIIIVLIVFF